MRWTGFTTTVGCVRAERPHAFGVCGSSFLRPLTPLFNRLAAAARRCANAPVNIDNSPPNRRWHRQRLGFFLLCILGMGCATRVSAATCAPATSGGSAPTDWPSYCWLDFSSYSDTLARSAGGQSFSFTLNDGSTLSFTVTVT